LLEHLTAEDLSFHSQPPPLIIVEENCSAYPLGREDDVADAGELRQCGPVLGVELPGVEGPGQFLGIALTREWLMTSPSWPSTLQWMKRPKPASRNHSRRSARFPGAGAWARAAKAAASPAATSASLVLRASLITFRRDDFQARLSASSRRA